MSKSHDLIVREFTGKNAGWPETYEVATIAVYSFRNSPRVVFNRHPMWRFNGDVLGPIYGISDPKQRLDALVYRAGAFRDSVHLQALKVYKYVTSPRARGWIAYDPVDHAPVGLSLWMVPEQFETTTLAGRIWSWFMSVRNSLVRTYLRLTRPHNSIYVPEMKQAYDDILESFDLESSEEKEAILTSAADPSTITYPLKYAYELLLFCITRPGIGIGRQFFEQTLEKMETSMRPVKIDNVNLPPQALIVATPQGVRLYRNYGFEIVKESSMETEQDPYTFSLMRKSYPS